MTVAERLLEKLKQAGIHVPDGSRCVRNRVASHERSEGAWSWRVDGPDGIPVGVGGWFRMTETVKAEAWDINTDEFGETTIIPFTTAPDPGDYWVRGRHWSYRFTTGERVTYK